METTMIEAPSPDDDIETLCAWWVQSGLALNGRLWQIKRRVEDYVREQTAVSTPWGVLEAQSAGWDWDEKAVAMSQPDLVVAETVTFSGTREQVERALSLVSEEVPEMLFETDIKIDKRKAGVRANAGGKMGEQLEALREKKPGKVVVA